MEDKEIIAKIKNCKTVDELKTVGKEIGYELTDEEAKAYFDKFNKSGELSDNELSNVSGGGCTRWRRGRAYSGNFPFYLITTTLNCCKLWEKHPRFSLRNMCKTCLHFIPPDLKNYSLTSYCKRRTYDNDPLNPKN